MIFITFDPMYKMIDYLFVRKCQYEFGVGCVIGDDCRQRYGSHYNNSYPAFVTIYSGFLSNSIQMHTFFATNRQERTAILICDHLLTFRTMAIFCHRSNVWGTHTTANV